MAAVPVACSAGLPGGAPPGTPIPVDDDVDGLPQADNGPPGTSGCEAFIQAVQTCGYGYGYDYGGDSAGEPRPGGTAGYDYEGTAGYYEPPPPPDYPDYPTPYTDEWCEYYLGQAARYGGAACAAAADNLFACLAQFACEELDTSTFEELCAGPAAALAQACGGPEPEPPPDIPGTTGADTFDPSTTDPTDTAGDLCPDTGTYSFDGSCGAMFDDCFDGNSYALTCTPPAEGAGLHTCVCEMNGEQTASFEIDNPCNTIWVELANTECGFPTAS